MKYIFQITFTVLLFACSSKKEQVEKANNVIATKEDALKEATKKYPDSIILIQNLAAYYLNMQNYDAALSTINNAIAKTNFFIIYIFLFVGSRCYLIITRILIIIVLKISTINFK